MGTFANSEDPDEMPHYQGLHSLLRIIFQNLITSEVDKAFTTKKNSLCAYKTDFTMEHTGLWLKVRNRTIIFLFFSQNICCGYSIEPSQ